MSATSVTGVVEQMLDHAAHGRWGALHEILAPDFEIVEPASLPYGGVHRGITGYVALMQAIGALFELEFDLHRVTAVGPCEALLQMTVGFTSRTSGASVTLHVLELVTVRDGLVTRSEIFVSDTAALLQVLSPREAGSTA
jgi:ketosteroid isomerase-like protein